MQKLINYLSQVDSWFSQRYNFVESSPLLRRLYKKKGCEILYGRRVDVHGENYDLQGPAVLLSTHHINIEPGLLTALTKDYIFWVGDIYMHPPLFSLRAHGIPMVRSLFDRLGIIEVNRRVKSVSNTKRLLEKSIAAIEKGKIVGIMPLGISGLEVEHGHKFDVDKAGFIGIVQYIERNIGSRVPIIPVGVRKEKRRFVVTLGKKFFLPDNIGNPEEYAEEVIAFLDRLASA